MRFYADRKRFGVLLFLVLWAFLLSEAHPREGRNIPRLLSATTGTSPLRPPRHHKYTRKGLKSILKKKVAAAAAAAAAGHHRMPGGHARMADGRPVNSASMLQERKSQAFI
eukprot:GHVS01064084.1.p1 GENE.GHVS01064084.1~~GHVS01064084.1.p1  ORF type:complete len:111 (+),score=20.36 GHVS01064084.1:170-502(+)